MLRDRETIAIEMLKGSPSLVTVNMDKQLEIIGNALDFADYFLALSRPDDKEN